LSALKRTKSRQTGEETLGRLVQRKKDEKEEEVLNIKLQAVPAAGSGVQSERRKVKKGLTKPKTEVRKAVESVRQRDLVPMRKVGRRRRVCSKDHRKPQGRSRPNEREM